MDVSIPPTHICVCFLLLSCCGQLTIRGLYIINSNMVASALGWPTGIMHGEFIIQHGRYRVRVFSGRIPLSACVQISETHMSGDIGCLDLLQVTEASTV